MKLFYLYMLVWVFFYSCCNKQKTDGILELNALKESNTLLLSDDYPEYENAISLSEIADTVFYRTLDLDKNTDIIQLYYTDSIIVVNDRSYIYLFNYLGQEKNKISVFSGSFDVLETSEYIYIYSFLKKEINKYDLKGNKINTIKLKNDKAGYYGYFFSILNDSLFAISNINEGYNKDQLIFVNSQGVVVHRIPNYEKFSPSPNIYSVNREWFRCLYRQNKNVYYHPFYNDTLFIVKNHQLIPQIIEHKIEKVPVEHRIEYTGKNFYDFAKYCQNNGKYATRFFNSSRYVFIEYKNGSIKNYLSNYLIYDKKTKVLYRICNNLNNGLNSKILHFGIENDYDGGLAFSPSYLCGDYLIMVNAGDMQGEKGKNTRELYLKGKMIKDTLYKCKSDKFINVVYQNKTDKFFNKESNENKIILMIVKLKSL